ncbi:MAG TPA: hypothetical protein VED84_02510 [Acidimicrobiales bacterium]|nr:hypothetical protein [Acidimicrobiales bacterium]
MAGALAEEAAELVGIDPTVETILEVQLKSGMIPWYPGGHADPWNHVEAVMALSAAGEFAAAARGLEWLAGAQRPDGSWHASYSGDGSVEEPRIDTNGVAYVATGVLHHLFASGDLGCAEEMFAVVDAALGFVVALVRPAGDIPWSVEPSGRPAAFSLLAASSSIHESLRSGTRLATALGRERPAWEEAAARVGRLIAEQESFFADNSQFAMDWYYPVLAGVLGGRDARARLRARFAEFVWPAAGVLCRADRRWVTTAETAECAVAFARVGWAAEASRLLSTTDDLRRDDGSYTTGLVYPERSEFPPGERTTYSAAAVVVAADVLAGGVGAALFDRLR